MKPVLALNMWFPIQFNEAIIKFLRFAKTVAISRIAPCYQSPELCVAAPLRFLCALCVFARELSSLKFHQLSESVKRPTDGCSPSSNSTFSIFVKRLEILPAEVWTSLTSRWAKSMCLANLSIRS